LGGFFLRIVIYRVGVASPSWRRKSEPDWARIDAMTDADIDLSDCPVLRESCYFLLARRGRTTPAEFLRQVTQGVVKIFNLEQVDLERMVVLIERYADLPLDFADACLVVLAESLREGRILTVDRRDFTVYRWHDTHGFENLLI
jgi:uncharacterized protein